MASPDNRVAAQPENSKRDARTPSRELAYHAVDAVLSKKAYDVAVMDMREVSGVAEYFVIASGGSDLQIKAISDAVQEQVEERCGERPWHTEGVEHRRWVLLDYVDLVVHIFNEEKRAFYDLERLWGDAPIETVSGESASADEVSLLQASS